MDVTWISTHPCVNKLYAKCTRFLGRRLVDKKLPRIVSSGAVI